MIKVELLYKVSMLGSDWTMSPDEFEEIRKDFLEIPDYVPVQRKRLYSFEEKIKGSWGEVEDSAEDCPDYIDPPEMICDNGSCSIELSEETQKLEILETSNKDPEDIEQEPRPKGRPRKRDYSYYARMVEAGGDKESVSKEMINRWGISKSTARGYYYTNVMPLVDLEAQKADKIARSRAMEKEKKVLLRNLETKTNTNEKIQVIPASKPDVPEPGKLFSKEFKEMIQKKTSGSDYYGRSKG